MQRLLLASASRAVANVARIATLATLATLFLAPLAACDAGAEAVIGPEGGSLASEDGRMLLEVPRGALDEDVRVSIEMTDDSPFNTIGSAYAVEPSGLALHVPAWVVFDISGDRDPATPQITGEQEAGRGTIIVGQRGDAWPPLADRSTDEDAGTTRATALYLSTFALLAESSSVGTSSSATPDHQSGR